MTVFPEAAYFIIASRLRPGLDGGYTVSAMRRALDFERHGGVVPTILTVEFAPDVDELRDEFFSIGLATPRTDMRNLYADLRANPTPLRDFARGSGEVSPTPDDSRTEQRISVDSSGRPWRIHTLDLDGVTRYTDYLDADGRRLLRLPFISGRVDWHRADAQIDVFDEDEAIIGQLAGFGALYRFWVENVVAASGFERNVVVCEAKQVGELLAEGPRSYTLVHTVHNAHTLPPYSWDSPMDGLWGGWFDRIDDMDAVIWLTGAQRADAVRRFAEHANWVVVPHPTEPMTDRAPSRERELNRVVMVARLVEQKRVEDAIDVWPTLLERVPDAKLDIYGDGPLRSELESRITELGLVGAVVLHGHVPDAASKLDTAAALLLTSRHEGQPLVILEALARGCPVIAYDVHYGPADMIENHRSGVLVEPGDGGALVEALIEVIGDRDRNSAMSAAALEWANAHGPDVSMQLMSQLFEGLLAVEVGRVRTR
ncbi:MAG TPA: glycosyltransferase [Galbitalea sp.]|jgi:poly(glycerol-phosphate) alpha-glucosyltransferase|nr:glycosyltransferase [Galbitalea sp.]